MPILDFGLGPAGSTGQLQFNNNGQFGADPRAYWDGSDTSLTVNSGPNGDSMRSMRAAADVGASVTGNHFQALNDGALCFRVTPKGAVGVQMNANGATMGDMGVANGDNYCIFGNAVFNSVNTGNGAAFQFIATSAGASAFSQILVDATLYPGYTGSASTYGLRAQNGSAPGGTAYGVYGRGYGVAGLTVGVMGTADVGTKRIGVYGTSAGLVVTSLTFPGSVAGIAGAFSNANNTDDILTGFDNTTAVFRVIDGGHLVCSGNSANTSTSYDFGTATKGNFRILANGNTDVQIGSTNNVPIGIYTNGTLRATFAVTNLLTLVEGLDLAFGTTTGTRVASGSTQKLGFWGATPIVKPTVTGSRSANAALASLLTQLATMGLVVDSSSA